MIYRYGLIYLMTILTACAFSQMSRKAQVDWPKVESRIHKDPSIEKKIKGFLKKMSLEEKVGQMLQAEIKHVTPADVKKYHLGSILNGGGSFPNNNKQANLQDWLKLADSYYKASIDQSRGRVGIPVIWGTDAVHGHNNVLRATIFPHNIGLGAMRNPELVEKIAQATALEVIATGQDWIFAPTVAVVQNDRWGRTYEGYSEEPSIVKDYAKAIVDGIQGIGTKTLGPAHLIATLKHFIGDGGTENGKDQGNNKSTEQELLDIHAPGYLSGLAAGAQTVMASFNSWKGDKVHGNKYLLSEVLKNKLGFDGFVIGDWNGHGQITGCTNSSCTQVINAGVDMVMVPENWKELFFNTLKQVRSGQIKLERINDAVSRILRVKLRAGIFDRGLPSKRTGAGDKNVVGSSDHRKIARQAVRESLVLLKNNDSVLPLKRKLSVLVTGAAADNIGQQSGGWTLSWQGTGNSNDDFPGATSIYAGIEKIVSSAGGRAELSANGEYEVKPDVAIVVFGETPYAEGQGDLDNLLYNWKYPQDLKILKRLKAKNIPVVSVFITGRPLWINYEINQSDAFVVAWLPGSEGAGIADVLFRTDKGKVNFDFKGKLSFSWPRYADQTDLNFRDEKYNPLFPYGFGLTYVDRANLKHLSESPFSSGSKPLPNKVIQVFKGRTISPFVNYVGDFKNWQFALAGDVGKSAGGLVTVSAIDKDVQEDARKIIFHGGDANYYFQSPIKLNLANFVKKGYLKMDLRVDQHPNHEANLLMGLGKFNFNDYLNTAPLNEWKKIAIKLSCFSKHGADFKNLNMPMSLATFGSMQLAIANMEIVAEEVEESINKIYCD